MPLAPRNPQIPGTTKPAVCNQIRDGKKCGSVATNTISGKMELMGNLVPVKIQVCDICIQRAEFQDSHKNFSIGESE